MSLTGEVPSACHRCGGRKRGPLVPCKECGFVPNGDDRAVAWLFSLHHLTEAELDEAAARVRAGERPDPSRALRDGARRAMGAAAPADGAAAPLSRGRLLGLTLLNVLVTPLAGFAVWWGLRDERPVAARQALRVTAPVAALVGAALLAEAWARGALP